MGYVTRTHARTHTRTHTCIHAPTYARLLAQPFSSLYPISLPFRIVSTVGAIREVRLALSATRSPVRVRVDRVFPVCGVISQSAARIVRIWITSAYSREGALVVWIQICLRQRTRLRVECSLSVKDRTQSHSRKRMARRNNRKSSG